MTPPQFPSTGLPALVLALALAPASSTPAGSSDGVGLTPPLGWNTWKTCGDEACTHDYCDEHEVKSTAEAMQANGMLALGYNYIVLDDCWAYTRDNTTGELTWDAERFPSGMPNLTTWLHDRGFKFGLYTSGGDQTCSDGGRGIAIPGSEGHYQQDAATFAEWGIDYVKLDWCGDVKNLVYGLEHGRRYHKEFAQAVQQAGRPMFLEAVAGYWFLRSEISDYYHAWRFCEDHHDDWESTNEALACRLALVPNVTRGEPGSWPHMDFLMTGGNGCAPYVEGETGMHCPGQTDEQYKTEFVLWSLTQSPMIVATDVRNMTDIMQAALLNEDLLSLHQNTAMPPGTLLRAGRDNDDTASGEDSLCAGCQLWGRALDDDAWLVALVNRGTTSSNVTVTWGDLGFTAGAGAAVRDLWSHVDLPPVPAGQDAFTALLVPSGGTTVVQVTMMVAASS